ncbi:hypothetical protein SB778_46065, partial [Paraburkholderia sp. SIMBA_050]
TNNRKTIEIGNTIKISESVFTTWLKLLTWVDRTAAKKEEGHIKSSASYIAKEILGYTATRGMYNVFQCLYEVGLIDLK